MREHHGHKGVTLLVAMGMAAVGWSGMALAQAQMQRQANPPSSQGQTGGAILGQQAGGTLNAQNNASALLPQGVTPKSNPDTDAIRDVCKAVTESALTKNDFKSLTGHFVDTDRDRIRNSMGNMNYDDLNNAIDQFNNTWQSKYNQKFGISSEKQTYNNQFLSVAQGEINNPSQVRNFPLNPSGQGGMSAGQQGPPSYLDKGRDIAVAVLPASHGLPELNASFVHQGLGTWRLALPASVDAQTLKGNLVNEINALNASSSQWPADSQEAERIVTHRILMAIYNATPGAAGGSMR